LNIHPEVVRKDGKARLGRGFSRGELKEAEVDFKQALRLAVPVDLRRKTKHEENVHILKQYLSLRMPKISKPPKPSKKPLKKPSKPMKAEVMEQKPAKPTKPTKQKKTTEIRKPSKRAKAPKAERTTSKKSPAKRKIVKSKGKEKT
jgi:large subunit ribosomal protein L13e